MLVVFIVLFGSERFGVYFYFAVLFSFYNLNIFGLRLQSDMFLTSPHNLPINVYRRGENPRGSYYNF